LQLAFKKNLRFFHSKCNPKNLSKYRVKQPKIIDVTKNGTILKSIVFADNVAKKVQLRYCPLWPALIIVSTFF